MRTYFLFFTLLFFSKIVVCQCLLIDIEAVSQPFCQGSYNGGQLQANVTGGSGNYTYEWVNSNGTFLPGGPQTNAITYSFLPINLECWVYVTDVIEGCVDSASYTFTEYVCLPDTTNLQVFSQFDINPVGYNTFSECEIQLENEGCQVQFKPEFIVSHENENIELNDLIIEYYNSQSVWKNIEYTINSDGQAVGYWGSETGETLNCDELRIRPVRVKFNQFNPTAPQGLYTAILRVWSINENGDLLDIISQEEPISLTLMDTVCDELQINISVNDATCPDQSNGHIELEGMGGQEPYLFSFDNSTFSTTNVFDNLSYGMYYFSIKDSSGCYNSDSVFVNPAPLLPDSIWFTNLGPNSATINWQTDSLVDGYRFRYKLNDQAWSLSQIVASGSYNDGIAEEDSIKILNNLSSLTTYQLQVKTNSLSGCVEGWSSSVYTFTTTMEDYNYNLKHSCQQTNSGHILFEIDTENNYEFEWNGPNGFTSSDTSINNLAPGDYQLLISYDSEVIFDTLFTILVSDNNIELILNGTESLYNSTYLSDNSPLSLCDTSNFIGVGSGFSNFLWSNGNVGSNTTIFLSDSILFVEALDTNSCLTKSDTLYTTVVSDFINLMQANVNEDYIQSSYNLCSNGPAIELDVSPFISGDYDLQWHEIEVSDTITISALSAFEFQPNESTSYSLEISNCFFDFDIDYFQVPVLQYQLSDPLCNGDTNGSVILYSDSISPTMHFGMSNLNNDIFLDNLTTQFTDTVDNLMAGQYIITLENIWNCTVEEMIELTHPDPLSLTDIQTTDIECYADSNAVLSYSLSGGTPPYNYLINSDSSLLSNQLYAGNYQLLLYDANHCQVDTNFVIDSPEQIVVSVIDSLFSNASCFGDNDGQISVNVEGGISPYLYQLNGQQQLSPTFEDLEAENYIIVVEDSEGCSTEIEVEIIQPSQNLMIQNYVLSDTLGFCSLCYGDSTGSLAIDLTGGSMPYTIHELESQNTYTSSQITNLVGGTEYQFYATDVQGCYSDTISILCHSPDPLVISSEFSSSPSCCNSCDALIQMQTSGGVQPYQYLLNNSTTQSDPTFSQLCGDSTYSIIVTDNLGCAKNDSFTVENISCLTIDTINFINSQLSAVQSDSCNVEGTGKIFVVASQGVGDYSLSINDLNDTIESSSYLFDELYTGEHTIYVQDSQACIDSITVIVPDITPITTELVYDTMYCMEPYLNNLTNDSDLGAIYAQSSEDFNSNFLYSLDQLDSANYISSGAFTNLSETSYTLNVKDNNNCIYEYDIELPFYSIEFDYSAYDVSCAGSNDGSIQISNIISESNTWFSLNEVLMSFPYSVGDLQAGQYDLTSYYSISDSINYCYNTESIVISENDPLGFSYSINSISCYGFCDGSISIDSAYGGNLPYTFVNMNTAETNSVFENLCAGQYTIKMTDSVGCLYTQNLVLTEENAIYPIIDNQNGVLTVIEPTNDSPSMGTPPYTYQWYLNDIIIETGLQDTLSPSVDGLYYVIVTDSLDCKGQSSELNLVGLAVSGFNDKNLTVYPNPVNDKLVLTSSSISTYEWQLIDLKGRLLKSGYLNNQLKIDTSDLPSGMHILFVKNIEGTSIYKILKQ